MSAVLSAIAAHRTAYANYAAAIDVNPSDSPAVLKAGDAERAALNALFAASVFSLSDVAAKAAYLTDEVDAVGDYFAEEGGETLASFLQSFRMPADPLASLIAEFREYEAAQAKMTDDEADDLHNRENGGAAFQRLWNDPPTATTMTGVEAALQLMADEDAKGNDWLRTGFIERAVLPFFNGKPWVDPKDNTAALDRLLKAHRAGKTAEPTRGEQ